MIVKRYWSTRRHANRKEWRGWFLFGLLPVYIEQIG